MDQQRQYQERLWAPWRLGYIKGSEEQEPIPEPDSWLPGADKDCFLCRAAANDSDPEVDRQLLRVSKTELTVTVLNRYPYSNAHLLVSPRRHVATLADLTDAEHLELQQVIAKMTKRLTDRVSAQGFNVGLNLGQIAGSGVPGHLHWHIVPRWPGDHNFMPTTSGAKVIPQALEAAWELLKDEQTNQP